MSSLWPALSWAAPLPDGEWGRRRARSSRGGASDEFTHRGAPHPSPWGWHRAAEQTPGPSLPRRAGGRPSWMWAQDSVRYDVRAVDRRPGRRRPLCVSGGIGEPGHRDILRGAQAGLLTGGGASSGWRDPEESRPMAGQKHQERGGRERDRSGVTARLQPVAELSRQRGLRGLPLRAGALRKSQGGPGRAAAWRPAFPTSRVSPAELRLRGFPGLRARSGPADGVTG